MPKSVGADKQEQRSPSAFRVRQEVFDAVLAVSPMEGGAAASGGVGSAGADVALGSAGVAG
ncbi:MAG TPA: hypothetical protein VG841_07115 [Caulobacterales bacterium]|nr:hypothetical protein [Caulobacterales bacterium]